MSKMVLTSAGIAEIVNAEKNGTAPVKLTHVAFGTGQYTATAERTALQAELKRFDVISGGGVGDNLIHVSVQDESFDSYTVYEIGVFTESGTLFAVYSQSTPLNTKAEQAILMQDISITLGEMKPESIVIGDTNFQFNSATTEREGVIELASEAEAKAGTDTHRAITPKTLGATIEGHDNIVHKKGAEAITGYKCFEGSVGKRDITSDISVTPTANKYSSFDFSDKNNKKYASVVGSLYTDGDVGAILATNRTINGVEYHSQIHVRLDKNGTAYATAPTPAKGDKSTKIATTAWVADQYLPLAGGTMTGTIKFAGDGKGLVNAEGVAGLTVWSSGNTSEPGTVQIKSGDTAKNSFINIYSATHPNSPGLVYILANNGVKQGSFGIHPDGFAMVNNKRVTVTGDCLPVSGGAMTATKAITRDVANSFLGLHGGTGNNNDGAQLYLCGAEHPDMPGMFQLHARNSSKVVTLQGDLDGKLTWNDKYVLNNSFQMPTDGGAIMLTAGTSSTGGAYFRLYGKSHSSGAGQFNLAATDGTNTKTLLGKPDGTLTWGGANVITSAGGTIEGKLYLNETPVIRATSAVEGGEICLYGGTDGYANTIIDSHKGNTRIMQSGGIGRLEIDHANMSVSFDGKDITLGYPNYNAVVVVGKVLSYTAPVDGWIVIDLKVESGVASVLINGKTVGEQGGDQTQHEHFLYPVRKNDYIEIVKESALVDYKMKFFPNR